ncbi:MAG: Thiamine pyrophosphokinase [Chloroflexi bacterium]|nr:Thiamine pyrophosphokinase [Chloroflexota bacterium]
MEYRTPHLLRPEEVFILRTIIVANGLLKKPQILAIRLQSGDLLIAADGGLQHLHALGLTPDVVIGDLDSVTPEQLRTLRAEEVEIIQHPPRKDETDLELALLYAVERSATDILVFGALGARWDMTLGNILLLAHPQLQKAKIRLVDGDQEMRLLVGGETLSLTGQPGDTVSLLPLCGDAVGVTTQGLAYGLENGYLRFGFTRGLSNVLRSSPAHISLEEGFLCVVKKEAERVGS